MTIADSSTENHSMALQALQTQQAQNITPPPTQNMLFHPCPPLSVDTNSPATQARDQVTLISSSAHPLSLQLFNLAHGAAHSPEVKTGREANVLYSMACGRLAGNPGCLGAQKR